MGCRSSRVLRDRVWTRPGRVGAACDAWVLGLLAAHVRGCMGARLCRDQGEGWVGKRGEPSIIMGERVVQTTRRRCRPERRVNHVARRSNELDVEKVQPAAFTCGRKIGLPAGMAPHCSVKVLPHGSHRTRFRIRGVPSSPSIESFPPGRYPLKTSSRPSAASENESSEAQNSYSRG